MATNISNSAETATEKTPIQEKRDTLRKYSALVSPLVKAGLYENVNEAIIETQYKNDINKEFKTFRGWIAAGFKVKKGEHGFIVWGRPTSKQAEEKGQEPDSDGKKLFPIAYIFSNAQVEKRP